ncbi:endoribonuclease Dicer3a [Dorcoceras hygrometricum]|uniref:Endoribonuclease Dicer3a n=1 Tax=Dorcoceras hygrometricum TaxID=472368 RepID=A0A2Z7B1V6_9LAMI|nr:endoribonuclease Dicer3a [Dorcoceras hygrometricum]
MKVFTAAMKRNTIAVFENGVGHTMISVMLIKEVGESLKNNIGDKKLILFLAPTVHLVHQHCKEIRSHTKLRAEEYWGNKGVDDWSLEIWQKEINDHDVLVMTPQILLDCLRKSFFKFESVSLVLLDECHRATGNHPYAKIMKDFYHNSTNRPMIFGMTASPVARKGVSSIKYSGGQIMELESLLDSRVYTTDDTMGLDEFIWAPKQTCRFYEPLLPPPIEVTRKLESSLHKFDEFLLDMQRLMSEEDKDTGNKYKMLRERLADDHAKLLFCLRSLGFICAYEAGKVCLENVPKFQEKCEIHSKIITRYESSLHEALSIIEALCPGEHARLVDVVNGGSDAADISLISSKLHELLEIFRTFGKAADVLCIVFFERIIAAEVIERVIHMATGLSHVKVTYITGSKSAISGRSPREQNEALESLDAGKVNLLFTTDVVEEGYQVPKCSHVIYFDLPKTVCGFVQSPGQVHLKDSQYIIMLERGNNKQIEHLSFITRNEISVARTDMDRDPDGCMVETSVTSKEAMYSLNVTGASVGADSSINLIDRYCKNLPRDKFFVPRAKFEFLQEGNLYRCKLVLPPNAAFQTMIGPEASNAHVSKQLVCLDACKKLHVMGQFNDHLLPYNEESPKKDCMTNIKAISSGAGTTNRKELHGSVTIRSLSGTSRDKLDGSPFYAYKMDFSCNITEEKFSSFVLLLETKLDGDVGNIEVELYLIAKFVRSSVSFSGLTNLDAKQVAKAKCFHELIFNSLFGKLFVKSTSGQRRFLLNTEESLWDLSNNYLLLPLESVDKASQECVRINWTGIDSCVSAVEFLKKYAWLNCQQSEATDDSYAHTRDSVVSKLDSSVIHLANRSASVDDLKGMVVVATHTGRIYSILDVLTDTSGESPFEGASDTSYSSFADYYKKKYKILLKYPDQPLLLLKQSHNSHNLLVDFRNEGASCKRKPKGGGKNVVQKPHQSAHMPPELLVGTDLRTHVMKSFYLLPSLMHRMESLMLASQLREDIAHHTGELNIPSSVILEALTTLGCMERFSMERLEFLGDAVLKYAASCHLFLKYPKKHEGQLSSHRKTIVSNSALHKFGVDRKLQEYIRDCPFDPRQWTAPGQRSIWPSPCNHCVDTREVPLDDKFVTGDVKIIVGSTCDRGHRWMYSKTISDCAEALIGAYYVGGGLIAALSLMKWLGLETELKPTLINDAIKAASLHSYAPHIEAINILESKIGYKFNVKGLLLEAITHATEGVDCCYQRLEFLGDSVLDILISRHLFENHKDIDPGELTDLRSASVNNNNFAVAAVKHNLHQHLLHRSECLGDQISSFVKSVSCVNSMALTPEHTAPKALGDLVESIVGAILIDSKLDLDEVWKVVEPLLSPIVTPEKLELPPSRELIELCDSLGYFVKENYTPKGDVVHAELTLQLEDVLLNGQGSGSHRKAAKGMAALCLLKKLESRGISFSKRKNHQPDQDSDGNVRSSTCSDGSDYFEHKNHKTTKLQPNISSDQLEGDSTEKASDFKDLDIPVLPPIKMNKGGPRTSLYDLCKKLQWPMPSFDTIEQKSRTLIQFGDIKGFNSFESEISLTIPGFGVIKITGEARADKKSSFDSAALMMMYELVRLGKIIISE